MNDVSIIIPTNRGPPIVGLKVEEKKRGNRSMRERCGREKCDGGGWCYCYYWYHRSGDCGSLLSICTQELKSTIKFHPLAADAPIPIPIPFHSSSTSYSFSALASISRSSLLPCSLFSKPFPSFPQTLILSQPPPCHRHQQE